MYFDGTVLKHVTNELKETILGGRINKIQEIAESQFLITIYNRTSYKLLISVASKHPRIHLLFHPVDHIQNVSQFTLTMRKFFENGIISSIKQVENDRVICIEIEKRNEYGDQNKNLMWIEIMGRHANLIITNNDRLILDAYKTILAFENNQRSIYQNLLYEPFPNDQLNPFMIEKETQIDLSKPLYKTIQGLSPLIQKELSFRHPVEHNILQELQSLLNHPDFVYYESSHIYSYLTLTHLENETPIKFSTINELLDHHYSNIDKKDLLSDKHRDLMKTISRVLLKHKHKLEHLQYDYKQTDSSDKYRIKGDLIQSNLNKIKKGMDSIDLFNYYTQEIETVLLDNKKSAVENMNSAYKKAKKIRASIPHLKSQIQQTKMMITYLETILSQVNFASPIDLIEIEEELRSKKILKQQKKRPISSKKKSKSRKPNYKSITVDDVIILVGMNNIQNAYITHQVAQKHHVFFHVKHGSGSHVIVTKEMPLSETVIRAAAQLASYYSPQSNSSSVEVIYTDVKNIKKIKGQHGSNVAFSSYQSIFIDPDYKTIVEFTK